MFYKIINYITLHVFVPIRNEDRDTKKYVYMLFLLYIYKCSVEKHILLLTLKAVILSMVFI
jgi:hypothetical protein